MSSYTYNAFGDLTSSTNAKGVTTNLSYDGIGRILIRSIPEGEHCIYIRFFFGK
ncbi:RHS repeat protein [Leptospira santarosai str. 200403458]|nr:RHS repeat protein [Leptospira santarosai str. 200403458]